MLVAIVDCLVPCELQELVKTLERDNIRCLSTDAADSCIDLIHDEIESHVADPIVIYGKRGIILPHDDCDRLWLCCGPETSHDLVHAPRLGTVTEQDLERRARAIRADYRLVTFVEAQAYFAEILAQKCVQGLNLGDKATDILLARLR
jgi:hypothetical protein